VPIEEKEGTSLCILLVLIHESDVDNARDERYKQTISVGETNLFPVLVTAMYKFE
jgi:hypothetical protein